MINTLSTARNLNRRSWLACNALLFASLVGCGGEPPKPTGTVKGTVSLDGKPYSDAAIVFLDLTSGQAASVNISDDGSYVIEEPLWVGNYNVYLAPKLVDDGESAEAVPVKIDETVPEKYWNEATTDIKYQLKEGENTFAVEFNAK